MNKDKTRKIAQKLLFFLQPIEITGKMQKFNNAQPVKTRQTPKCLKSRRIENAQNAPLKGGYKSARFHARSFLHPPWGCSHAHNGGIAAMTLPAQDTNGINAILDIFRSAGWELQPVFKWKETEPSIWCNYNGNLRPIHPDVCQWHQDRDDPECVGCERNTQGILKKVKKVKKNPEKCGPRQPSLSGQPPS